MGIRVDEVSLHQQLGETGTLNREQLDYHQKILNNLLPLSIGGGIGQSRVSMLMLRKHHIGQVQVSVWSNDTMSDYSRNGCDLLV